MSRKTKPSGSVVAPASVEETSEVTVMAENNATPEIENLIVPAAPKKRGTDVIVDAPPPVASAKPSNWLVTTSDGYSGTVQSVSASGAKYAFMRHLELVETTQEFTVTPVE